MNYLAVTGSTKRKRELAESAMIHCISELMPRMRTLDIELILKKLKDKEVVGWCYEGENKREFFIDIEKSLDGDELIETVCHEMVHVWQSATRKMKDLPFGRKMYMGKVYDETTAYEDEPWEVEAYEMQGKLLETFKKEYVI
tara:strand:- start:32 stop:457 length:426 start_codon:yes stop_codon:yes gene_type:complete